MTDIGRWRDLVHAAQIPIRTIGGNTVEEDGELQMSYYTVVPLTSYQMGNLVDAFSQDIHVNGDWWGEILDIVAEGMKRSGIKKLRSNRGNEYTLEDVETRLGTCKILKFDAEKF